MVGKGVMLLLYSLSSNILTNIYSVPIIVYFSNRISETEKVNNSPFSSVSQIYTFGKIIKYPKFGIF